MGTVGINFGAASSGAGFDVAGTVTSILAVSSSIESPWKTQLTNLKAQDTVFTTLGTDLAALSTAVSSFTNFDGVLSQKLGSSSDTNVLTLTAASTAATAGSHTVQVTSLASTSSDYTDPVVNASDILSGTLTLQVGTAAANAAATPTAAQTIRIGPASMLNGTTPPTTGSPVVTGSGATQAASVTIDPGTTNGLGGSVSFANAGAANSAAVVVDFGAGENIAAQVTTANAAFAAAGNTGMTAVASGNTLVISSAQGTNSGVAVTANTLVESVPTAANNTLTSLAQYINNGSYGVTANVVTSSAGSRLSLVSNVSGAAGQITLGGTFTDTTPTTPIALAFKQGQSGTDAVLSVDGLPTTSASNTVTGAIPGVTFQLLSGSPGTDVQVQITNDNSSVETAAAALVTAYNAVAADIKTQEGKGSTGAAEPLYGSPTLSQLQSQLSTMLSGAPTVGAIGNIQQLGFSVNPDGTMAVDNATLDTALNSHFSDIVGFFQNTGSFGANVNTTLNTLGSGSKTGLISLAEAENTSIEASLNLSVTNEDLLIAAEKISLTTELNTANQALQSIPQSLSEVNQIYSATTGYNQNTNG